MHEGPNRLSVTWSTPSVNGRHAEEMAARTAPWRNAIVYWDAAARGREGVKAPLRCFWVRPRYTDRTRHHGGKGPRVLILRLRWDGEGASAPAAQRSPLVAPREESMPPLWKMCVPVPL